MTTAWCHCEERQRRGNPPMERTGLGIAASLTLLAMTIQVWKRPPRPK
jgi:hypothetical protein